MPNYREEMEKALKAAFSPVSLEVADNSDQHIGHAGNPDGRGQTHFKVTIVAAAFQGLSRVAQHRLVYDALGTFFDQGVHSVEVETKAPA